ncbi:MULTISPECIES: translation initiation factor eIF-2B [Bacillaceae]|uniref:translation initiation factor eIF-2B n=1 Tax=Bacillaceae TaxID=186817 RepID=UPI00118891AA|nr:translation initiation factor eIF-2B [Bacillus sp. S3]QCJ44414.1 translation initiation factor eIF-2B [Bacillus sp. S3]
MKLDIESVRMLLPNNVQPLFDDIVEQRVLGASNHISMIGEMIESIALTGKKNHSEVKEIIEKIQEVTNYFIKTRGEASQAISNAIMLMTNHIESLIDVDLEEAVDKIITRKNSYLAYNSNATEKVLECASSVVEDMRNILVYDYSSTVDKLLKKIGGANQTYTIYIPESRIIDGGLPYVKSCKEAGHTIKFFPDAALMYYLKECDVALMGAETFFPNGTGFNTTGSDLVGLACDYYNIPLYFLTPLIKLDIRPIYGYKKELVINDLTKKLTKEWPDHSLAENIDFKSPELLGVEPKFISGFITEKGLIPTEEMFNVSVEYYKELGGVI